MSHTQIDLCVCVCVCVCVYMYLLVHAQTHDTYKTHTRAR